jgi:predicted ATPase
MMSGERFHVLTGGPGSGKSTLIDALQQAGFARTLEAGRSIIQDQVAIGGRALPWADCELYAELQLAFEMRSYREAEALSGPVFFDRGVPDIVGYLTLIGKPVPDHLKNAADAFRYNRRVLIAPPWAEIYVQDGERKQSLGEAARTFAAMVETYRRYGYELVEIPRTNVPERVRFVLDAVGLSA